MTKTFTRAGTSTLNGVVTYRFANDLNREMVLAKNGHTFIHIFELPVAMTKAAATLWLNNNDVFADAAPATKKARTPKAQDTTNDLKADIKLIIDEAMEAARLAADEQLSKQGSDWDACGFGWVNLFEYNGAKLDGRGKVGKILADLGVRQDYQRVFQIWNPGNYGGQSINIKEAAALAAAKVFQKHGFVAYSGSRLD